MATVSHTEIKMQAEGCSCGGFDLEVQETTS